MTEVVNIFLPFRSSAAVANLNRTVAETAWRALATANATSKLSLACSAKPVEQGFSAYIRVCCAVSQSSHLRAGGVCAYKSIRDHQYIVLSDILNLNKKRGS